MDNEQPRTNGQGQVLNVDLGSPSLKAGLDAALAKAGFATTADGVRNIVRDIVAGRIQYTNGILVKQT